MIRANEMTFENKWIREIGILNEYDFVNYNRAMKDLKEVILKDLQFIINNKILVTKSFLYRIGKEDNSQCSYCNQDTESIYSRTSMARTPMTRLPWLIRPRF